MTLRGIATRGRSPPGEAQALRRSSSVRHPCGGLRREERLVAVAAHRGHSNSVGAPVGDCDTSTSRIMGTGLKVEIGRCPYGGLRHVRQLEHPHRHTSWESVLDPSEDCDSKCAPLRKNAPSLFAEICRPTDQLKVESYDPSHCSPSSPSVAPSLFATFSFEFSYSSS